MMKFLKYLLYALLALIVVAIGIGLAKKGPFTYSKSMEIKASKAAVWSWINNFKSGDQWSPWNSLDTAMTKTFPEKDGVVGAVYSWKGNKNVGIGSQTITYMAENDSMGFKLEFKEPFESVADIGYKITGEDGKVTITQYMSGTNNFMGAIMSTVFGAEKMMDEKFTEGLTALKKLAEAGAANENLTQYKVEEVMFPNTVFAVTEAKGMAFTDLNADWYGKQYQAVGAYIGKNKLGTKNQAYGIFKNVNDSMMKGDVYTGMDVDKSAASGDGVFCIKAGGKALKISYFGPYEATPKAYEALMNYVMTNKLIADYSIEHYVTDPSTVNGDWSKVQTDIYMMLK